MKPVIMIGSLGLDAVHVGLLMALLLVLVTSYVMWRKTNTALHDEKREHRFAEEELDSTRLDLIDAKSRLDQSARAAEEAKIKLARAEAQTEEQEKRFAEMAQGAVRSAHSQFVERADEHFENLIKPIAKNFEDFRERVDKIEKVRTEDKTLITEQVKAIGESLHRNTAETGKLVNALTAPKGGGRWGEMTLRNVMEQAGLSAHCDFNEQVNDQTEEGRQRPDAIINLPGERRIVIDSKVSLESYMAASSASEPTERAAHLKAHATAVQRHINTLASKAYQANSDDRVDFVAMFIPGENFFAAALEHAPDLLEKAYAKNVIVTTPSTLIGLAKTVSYVWRQEKMAENAREAAKLGEQLYDRIAIMAGHMEKVGKSLNGSVDHYNKMMGSLNKRVFPTMRKFEELEIAQPDRELPEPKKIESQADVPDSSEPPQLDLAG